MVDVVISGIGQSAVGRKLEASGLALTVDAALEAIGDAGLTRDDIDGLSTFPGAAPGSGFSPVGSWRLRDALGLELDWICGGGERPGQLGALIDAYAAIRAGLARHVLCFRTVKEGSGGATHQVHLGAATRPRAAGDQQWQSPYSGPSYVGYFAMQAQRHMHLYGTTREQFGQIAITQRRNASINPKGVYRDPMTMDDYLSARMISSPLGLFDCDAPVDGSTVLILSAADAAKDLKSRPVRIESVGGSIRSAASWDQMELGHDATNDSAQRMWQGTDLTPKDIDIGLLYDGFSFIVVAWLEALGICGKGEAGAFLEGGANIALDGAFPINPHGGQLSSGRVHGFGFPHEAVLQLRGEAGARQVGGDPRSAIVTNSAGFMAGCMLLVRD
ncbi:MAG: thiolase family protein [Novosphingobium sp.]|nr:thiolase family protein [Novosphingobium sp.]